MNNVDLMAFLEWAPGCGDEGAFRDRRARIGLYWLSSFSVSSTAVEVDVDDSWSLFSSELIRVEFKVGAIFHNNL